MNEDRELEGRLRELAAPDEADAERRAWTVIRTAYARREPVVRQPRRRRIALIAAAGVAALAIGLSPAGAKVGDLVSDVFSPEEGEPDAKPALRSLPAAGELLVESEQGPWVVREDGSKRLLGDYDFATWSPHGLFVAATRGRELLALEPDGDPRWTLAGRGRIADPRGAPSGFRIAYRSGDDLRVVAGDGTGDRLLAADVRPVAPAWRPIGPVKVADSSAERFNVLTYVAGDGEIETVNVDTGERLEPTRADVEQLSTPAIGGATRRAVSPDGSELATLARVGRRDQLVVERHGGERRRVLLSTRGTLTGPSWSPDGRWLLVGWPAADQWLFIPAVIDGGASRPRGGAEVVAFDRISEQFDPGTPGPSRFPRVAGWVLPQR
ncbi:MAG: LpqB family beta-propeller domain-containing protein [Solirubrobacterales bacterium]